ncbi:potassium-transporting ATPase subunit C [Nocardia arthritidis]|uniref:Potassium-transporting ATPase KdpC subunit n=1 Tax=Nocardia arthritidis TaxID=228602 RepID=A0A6G9YN46_9NOCA|nr:potassium-transporting ATPase subunit C [Nocardia arthritidis]QIS14634.1 potassium-transporting ATPase subunit C [Nocardia arthritidis]
MRISTWIRQHIAALRALVVLTVITGIAYPLVVFAVAQLPGLKDKADGSLLERDGKIVGSSLIGQAFTDGQGTPKTQYFQTRPSNAVPAADPTTGVSPMPDGYDATGSNFGNMGPESIADTYVLDPKDPTKVTAKTTSLLTTVCQRSQAVGKLEGVSGERPFCTKDTGVGAVLSVMGPRNSRGEVIEPTRVISINEPCQTTTTPFIATYRRVKVECAKVDANGEEDYSAGLIVPIRGDAPTATPVPTDAVTASASGLDPNISPAYAAIQVARIAKARNISEDQVRDLVAEHTQGRELGFMGEPRVNVLELNLELDSKYPFRG